MNSCTNSPEDGPVGPKHVETQQYTNKIVTSVGFHSKSYPYIIPNLVSCSSFLPPLLYPEDEGTAVLQNVMNYLPIDTVSHPSRPEPFVI